MKLNKKQIDILNKNGIFKIDLNTMTNEFGNQVGMYKNIIIINNKKSFKLQFINENLIDLSYLELIKLAKKYIKNENDIIKIEKNLITYHHNLNLDI